MALSTANYESHFRSANSNLFRRLTDVFLRTWDLGFTSFGGPPVHFHIFHQRFVDKYKWIDEQTYQEIFALCQALPGPGSTKLGYCISLAHAGFLPALLQFTLWCLPGAAGMYLLAIGIAHVPETLPVSAYALLSGLNAATVGVIAVSAVLLSERVISDSLTRIIVLGTGCAGLLYSALWYFPALMIVGGTLTLVWDLWKNDSKLAHPAGIVAASEAEQVDSDVASVVDERSTLLGSGTQRSSSYQSAVPGSESAPAHSPRGSIPLGTTLLAISVLAFLTILIIRTFVKNVPVEYKLFSNLFLAGTIIFGGGPVVVPLLNSYIVDEGWVSSRDFLIGLALIQAFPGPNFNFAVFLSALTASSSSSSPLATAFLGFVGIFSPGMVLATGMFAVWHALRQYRAVVYVLRGVNAAAVGLIWTAVYRLWEAGYLKPESTKGTSLGTRPLWVVVAAVAFVGNRWFATPPPVVIVAGGVLGLLTAIL